MQNVINLMMIRGTIVDEDEQEVEQTTEVAINADCIRSLNARRDGKPGTRLTFTDGGGFAVQEPMAKVLDLLRG